MYAVLELQKNDTLAALVNTYIERSQAEQQYHTVLSYAAVSSIPIHTVLLISDEGHIIKQDSYVHPKVYTPEEVEASNE